MMSSRDIHWDERYAVTTPSGGSLLIGRSGQVVSSGVNYSPGETLGTPHDYELSYYDRGDSYFIDEELSKCFSDPYIAWGLKSATYILQRAWTSNDDLELLGKLREKYDDSSFNAPVFVGELGEATDMLAGNLRRLASAFIQARKGNMAKAAKALRAPPPSSLKYPNGRARKPRKDRQGIAERWLELQYGWVPLLKDISNLSDVIATKDQPRKRRLHVWKKIDIVPQCSHGYIGATGTGSYKKQIIAYVEEDRPSWPERLGLLDPEVVAWELLPFSFVADWVLPIGDYLAARAFAQRVKGTFVTTTKEAWSVRTGGYSEEYVPLNCRTLHPDVGPLCWSRGVKMKRVVSQALPVPLPSFRNPREGSPNALENAVALVTAIFGSKIKVAP